MKPYYIAVAAITLDGKIAIHKKHKSSWTSKEDKKILRGILDSCDVILVGNNTYKSAISALSKRNCIVLTKSVSSKKQINDKLAYCNPRKININLLTKSLKYKHVGILGGAQVYAFCLEKKLLDELYITIEPLSFGKGISLFGNNKGLIKNFKLISIKKLNKQGTLLLRYKKQA